MDGDGAMKSAHDLPSQGHGGRKRASVKLTAGLVNRLDLPEGKVDYTFFDDAVKGFGVRVRAGGSKTFLFQYGKGQRVVIGSTSAISVGDARKTAEQLYARVKLGGDPARDKVEERIAATGTFKALAERYLAHQRTHLRERSYPDVERHLLTHAKPLHGIPATKILRRDVASCLGSLKFNSKRTQSGVATRNHVRASISALFSWALGEGLVEHNPVIGVNRGQQKPRERVLEYDELKLIWQALPDNDFGKIMRLLMLTGQRASEIAGLRRSELHGDAILLPGSRTKNSREHLIPLSPAAAAILDDQIRWRSDDRDLIFGKNGRGPFAGWSKAKRELDAAIEQASGRTLAHWTVHDLRRSFATHAGGIEVGVQPHIVEAILNHQSGFRRGVSGTYNRQQYAAEKRTALARWAEHLLATFDDRDSNVTSLRRGG
jgi:integrase